MLKENVGKGSLLVGLKAQSAVTQEEEARGTGGTPAASTTVASSDNTIFEHTPFKRYAVIYYTLSYINQVRKILHFALRQDQ